jgi:putative copper export protein
LTKANQLTAEGDRGVEAVLLNFLHLLAATVWVGGSLAIPLVITPVIRAKLPPEKRIEMIAAMGSRFRPFAWTALLVLALTGARRASLALGGQWSALNTTSYGQALRAKILLFVVLVLIQTVHDFVLGPRLRKLARQSSPDLARMRKITIGLASGGLLITLVILYVAASLRYR